MTSNVHRRLMMKRYLGAAVAAATLAVVFSTLVQMPQTAQALPKGCSISPELQPSADREGIGCGPDIDGGGGAMAGGASSSACNFAPNTADLPEGFFGFTSVAEYNFINGYGVKGGHADTTTYVKGNRVIGSITYIMNDNGTWRLSAMNTLGRGFTQFASFDCAKSKTGFTFSAFEDPDTYISPDGTEKLAPPTSTSPTPPTVDPWISTGAVVTALPGRPGEALVRVNLTNVGSTISSANVNFSLSNYSTPDLLALPAGTTCAVIDQAEHCVVTSIAPGATQTIVLHSKAVSTATVGSDFTFSVGTDASVDSELYYGSGSFFQHDYWTTTFDLEMPKS